MKINFGYPINKFFKYMNRPALRNCKLGKKSKIGTGSNCINVTIGNYSYMGKNNSISFTNIGNYCSIASYCAIGGGRHPTNYVSTSPIFYSNNNVFNTHIAKIKNESIKITNIGNDVWIGEKVFIKDGINVGNGAVIGAHSVVTHDVPSYSIVAGNPAKIIKYRFDENQIKLLEKSKWWEKDISDLKEHTIYFNDIDQFLEVIKE